MGLASRAHNEPTTVAGLSQRYLVGKLITCRHGAEWARVNQSLMFLSPISTISMADRILVLEKGHLIECGTHKALLTQDGHYAMLYRLHRQQIGEPA